MSTLVHIHAPKGHYIGQIRLYGHRKWKTVTVPCTRAELAMATAVQFMSEHHKRARVLLIAEWYDPIVVMECKR
jgi:hypothetical protein